VSEPELETRDREYQTRMYEAIAEAVISASLDPEKNVAFVRTGEVTVACLMQIAVMAATSQATSSPAKTRKFCDAASWRLGSLIASARQSIEKDGLGNVLVVAQDLGPVAGPLN
jgi:hypothetical protein